ncbi:MAG: hypothetical protein RLZZ597_1285 [Cyanobacteriota bacterium]|jgi:hypothetical protein
MTGLARLRRPTALVNAERYLAYPKFLLPRLGKVIGVEGRFTKTNR